MKARQLTINGEKTLSRHSDYEHTISGVLHRRVDLFHEAERIRNRLAEIKNDIASLDRTLNVLGYEGDLDAAMPRQKREVLFGRGELQRSCMGVLRDAEDPMTSRMIAQELVSMGGLDARDRRFVTDLTKRVSKCLRQTAAQGRVKKATDARGNVVWSGAA